MTHPHLLRSLIRGVLLESLPTRQIEEAPLTPNDLLKATVQYVAANRLFRVDAPETQRMLSKFIRDYSTLYRYWYDLPLEQTLEKLEREIRGRPFFSATQSMDDVEDRLWPDSVGDKGVVVAIFSGQGFEPLVLIRSLLTHPSVTVDPETRALAKRVLQDYGEEKEVCVTAISGRMQEIKG